MLRLRFRENRFAEQYRAPWDFQQTHYISAQPSPNSPHLVSLSLCDPTRNEIRSGPRVSRLLRDRFERSSNNNTMSRKSVLNPNATPFIPLSKKLSGMSFEGEYKVKVPETTGGETENTGDYQFPKAGDIQNADGAFDVSSSVMAHKTMLDVTDTLRNEIEDDRDLIVQALLAMFPHVSIDFLAELLEVNNGDMSDTIDMLEQLEIEYDVPETSGFGSKLPKQR